MSREMKKVVINMIKYDLVAGFIFVLALSVTFNIKVALIFFLGLIVSLINTIVNGLFIEYSLIKSKKLLLPLSYLIRIAIILLIALPFLDNLIQLLAYISGYIFHFICVVFYWIRKGKGSD